MCWLLQIYGKDIWMFLSHTMQTVCHTGNCQSSLFGSQLPFFSHHIRLTSSCTDSSLRYLDLSFLVLSTDFLIGLPVSPTSLCISPQGNIVSSSGNFRISPYCLQHHSPLAWYLKVAIPQCVPTSLPHFLLQSSRIHLPLIHHPVLRTAFNPQLMPL